MTVKLVRAYAGLPAGASYNGTADVEADLVAMGNAEWSLRSVTGSGGPGDVTVPGAILASDPYYGGSWNGVNYDDPALQNALDHAATFVPRKNVILPNKVCIRDGVHAPRRVFIVGADYFAGHINTSIYAHADLSLTTGFALNLATSDGSTADQGAPALGESWECGLFGLWLDNSAQNAPGFRLATFASTFIARDLRGYKQTQLLKKVSGQYIDNIDIARINLGLSYNNSEYGIEIPTGGGDALHIRNVNCPTYAVSGATVPELALSITATYGAQIEDMINGQIYLSAVSLGAIRNYHSELGNIICVNSSIAIRDSIWLVQSAQTYYPIDMQISGGSSTTYVLETDNVTFGYGGGDGTNEAANAADIRLSFQTMFLPKNTRRVVNMYGSQRSVQGVRLEKQDDTPLTEFNRWSHFLSDGGKWIGNVPFGSLVVKIDTSPSGDDYQGITAAALSSSNQYGTSTLAASTTYYYTSQLLFDSTALIGRSQLHAEVSQASGTGTNKRISLTVGYGNCTSVAIVRIYRGTSTGSYSHYVDIPSIKCVQFVDKGDYCNGVAWVDRGGSSAVTALSTTLTDGNWIQTPNGKVAVS